MISCIISNFDQFSEGVVGDSGSNLDYSPVPIAFGSGFTFKHCCFEFTNFSFWEEHAPDGESSAFFTQHTLGDGNLIDDPEFSNSVYDLDSGSPCIDTGFDGDWNGDESYGTDDVDEAELLGFPTDFIMARSEKNATSSIE